jgi:hypothetical protein
MLVVTMPGRLATMNVLLDSGVYVNEPGYEGIADMLERRLGSG